MARRGRHLAGEKKARGQDVGSARERLKKYLDDLDAEYFGAPPKDAPQAEQNVADAASDVQFNMAQELPEVPVADKIIEGFDNLEKLLAEINAMTNEVPSEAEDEVPLPVEAEPEAEAVFEEFVPEVEEAADIEVPEISTPLEEMQETELETEESIEPEESFPELEVFDTEDFEEDESEEDYDLDALIAELSSAVGEEIPEVEEAAEEDTPAVEETAEEDTPAVEETSEEEAPVVEETSEEEAPVAEEPAEEDAPAVEEDAEEEVPAVEEDDDVRIYTKEAYKADVTRVYESLKAAEEKFDRAVSGEEIPESEEKPKPEEKAKPRKVKKPAKLRKKKEKKSAGGFLAFLKSKIHLPKLKQLKIKNKKATAISLAIVLFCVITMSPIKGCFISDGKYIGISAAEKIAIEDAGILSDRAQDVHIKMIKMDGKACYKVEFSGAASDYQYIIDAETGDVLLYKFYKSADADK